MSSPTWLVARREITQRVRDKGFLASVAFVLAIVVGSGVVGGLVGGGDERDWDVGVVGQAPAALGEAVVALAPRFDAEVALTPLPDRGAAEAALEEESVDVVALGPEGLLAQAELDAELAALVQSAAARLAQAEALQGAGLSDAALALVLDPAPLPVATVEDDDGTAATGVAVVTLLLLFFTIFIYGLNVASGVVEEKSSRVVEVVLAAVRPGQLMVGKLVGIGLLGLAQVVLVLAAGLATARAVGLDLPAVAVGAAIGSVGWFVLGFVLYGALFAMAGALVSRQEDLQYTYLPVGTVLFVSYGAAFAVIDSPSSTFGQVLSFLPPTAPLVMTLRTAAGDVGALELGLAAALTAAAAAGLMALAARVYAGSVLRFGARVRLGDALRGGRSG